MKCELCKRELTQQGTEQSIEYKRTIPRYVVKGTRVPVDITIAGRDVFCYCYDCINNQPNKIN